MSTLASFAEDTVQQMSECKSAKRRTSGFAILLAKILVLSLLLFRFCSGGTGAIGRLLGGRNLLVCVGHDWLEKKTELDFICGGRVCEGYGGAIAASEGRCAVLGSS